jgi:transglutaminase-like putative cysteine protease
MASQLLLDQMGVPSRTVSGRIVATETPHILLLVKLDDYWYAFDPTIAAKGKHGLPVCLENQYGDYFTPNTLYITDSFRRAYPMSEYDLLMDKK